MSMPLQLTFTCSKCGHAQPFTFWQSLNATLDPGRKGELLSGSLTRFTCAQCQSVCIVNYPMLYHDMRQRLLIWLVEGPALPALPDLPFGGREPKYLRRWVSAPAELVEKIRIFDAGLDDRFVELYKLSLRKHVQEACDSIIYFAEFGSHPKVGEVIVFEMFSMRNTGRVAIGRAAFDNFSASIAPDLEQEAAQPNAWLKIDRDYAEARARRHRPAIYNRLQPYESV